jgi:cytochrome c oxidase subunit 2
MKQIKWAAGLLLATVLVTGCTSTANPVVNNADQSATADQAAVDNQVVTDQNTPNVNTVPVVANQVATQNQVVAQSAVKEFTMTAKNWEFNPAVITVKQGDTVKLHVKSLDVEHGITIPEFNVNVKLQPNKEETFQFVADKIGTFPFRCSVFCGDGHREMDGQLIVQ